MPGRMQFALWEIVVVTLGIGVLAAVVKERVLVYWPIVFSVSLAYRLFARAGEVGWWELLLDVLFGGWKGVEFLIAATVLMACLGPLLFVYPGSEALGDLQSVMRLREGGGLPWAATGVLFGLIGAIPFSLAAFITSRWLIHRHVLAPPLALLVLAWPGAVARDLAEPATPDALCAALAMLIAVVAVGIASSLARADLPVDPPPSAPEVR